MDQGKNIFEIDKKRKIINKILLFCGLIIIGVAIFFGITYLIKNQKKIVANSVLIDEYFIAFTAKNVETFEMPVSDKSIYSNNDNACGYFYKNTPITYSEIKDEVKILSTIDYMLTCYLSNPNENGCGVTYNNNTKKFSVSKNEVNKYMKLLYGPNISYEDQSVIIEYNQIKKLDFINDKYQFEYLIKSENNLIEKYIYSVISKNTDNENEIIITKSAAYFEETNNNGVIEINVYRFDDKKEKLSSLKNINEIDTYLQSAAAPLYKLTFDRHPDDGRYIFKNIEPVK